jgi:PQQ-dependent catabolism-associated CXXCW motif protein
MPVAVSLLAAVVWIVTAGAELLAAELPPGAEGGPVAEPPGYRMDEYRKPVPATLKGAKVISTDEAIALWTSKSATFIDVYPYAPKPDSLPSTTVWREPVHYSIEDAKWLPNVGYGVLSEPTETFFKTHLEALTGADKSKPLVFFCLRNCWMSWNSAKRALTYGYSNVIWFPDGTDAWQETGQPVAETKPVH